MPCFLLKNNTCFLAFHVAQMKYVIFLHRLIQQTGAVHAYVSPQPSWFILGATSTLGQVIFIWFRFKLRNEMK